MEKASVGELLMIERVEEHITRRRKMAFDRLFLSDPAQHWQKVNAVSNKAGILKERLPCRRNPNDDLLLACQTMQQKLKAGEQRNVESAAQPRACALQIGV